MTVFFANNSCTGIFSVNSNLVLWGDITLLNNTGYNGGGMVMCSNSAMYLAPNVSVYIQENHATHLGGGIYVCKSDVITSPCFYQTIVTEEKLQHSVFMINNTATVAGSALYGGSIDTCFHYSTRSFTNTVFDKLFQITSYLNDLTLITSVSNTICFCNGFNTPNCTEYQPKNLQIYPGAILSISAVVVGQRNGTVPGVVVAELQQRPGVQHRLAEYQNIQYITSTQCKILNYTIFSNIINCTSCGNTETIRLSVQNTLLGEIAYINNVARFVDVQVRPCPVGFALREDYLECSCVKVLSALKIQCNISETSIYIQCSSHCVWIGFLSINKTADNTAVLYNSYCPTDYCIHQAVTINTTSILLADSQDVQCSYNRTGIICGGCKTGFSAVLGSSRCLKCSTNQTLRMIGLLICFILLGPLILLVLRLLELNVADGTLNAVIFYVNVVRSHSSIFFLPNTEFTTGIKVISLVIAWMNLDLGIEVCFYNGMNAIAKSSLQFAFPFYLWGLAGLLIALSRKSPLVLRLMGRNGVKLLATLILISYTRLLRTIITVCQYTTIFDVNGAFSIVWLMDGNVPYFHKEHAFLFTLAVLVAGFTLPYTLALLFIQCLRKRSDMKLLFWVNKLKPFFDAYTGPYKDSYHFWTGFLLLARIILLMFLFITFSDPIINLTLIFGMASLLFVVVQLGIYKKHALVILEGFIYFNLSILSAATSYNRRNIRHQALTVELCVGSVLAALIAIVFYRVYKRLCETERGGRLKAWFINHQRPWKNCTFLQQLLTNQGTQNNNEIDSILANAPPVMHYNQYREPLIATLEDH